MFVGDSIARRTDKTLNKGDDMIVCFPVGNIKNVTEREKEKESTVVIVKKEKESTTVIVKKEK